MTNSISAADNHSIEISDRRWRLLANDTPTAEATPRGLRYGGKFARTRRLPDTGMVPRESIVQVVLGWQQTDESWHLGLILAPQLAEERGSRWCELVHWPDPDVTVFEELAEDAATHLAQVLDVPYYGLPPQPVPQPEPPKPLPDLPLEFGLWTLKPTGAPKDRLVIERQPRWKLNKYGRIVWLGFWSVVYLWLSLATLTSEIALPNAGTILQNPQWLPYLGIATFFLLLGMVAYQMYLVTTKPDRLVIDPHDQSISAWTGDKVRWKVGASEIQSVYVSEVVKRSKDVGHTEYGELSLHLGGGNFRFMVRHKEPQDNSQVTVPDDVSTPDDDQISELTRNRMHTNLQATGLYIADALGNVPVWWDVRPQ